MAGKSNAHSIDYSQHFVSTHHWKKERLESVLSLASQLKKQPLSHLSSLPGRVLSMIFFNPSLRTRSSFSAGMAQLGGSSYELAVGQGAWKLEHKEGAVMDSDKPEHIKDAARSLSCYADAIAVRAFPALANWEEESAEPVLSAFAQHSQVPVINMESCLYHPCQAMADMMALSEKFGGVKNLKGKKFVMGWVYHPKPTPLAVNFSSALAAAQFGMDVTIAHPPDYGFGKGLMDEIKKHSEGGKVSESEDLQSAVQGADAIYAKSYCPPSLYGKLEQDAALRAKHKDWRITEALMKKAPKASVMHCLPMRRNVEIDDSVADGRQSVIYNQADNRLHVQKAILLELLAGKKK